MKLKFLRYMLHKKKALGDFMKKDEKITCQTPVSKNTIEFDRECMRHQWRTTCRHVSCIHFITTCYRYTNLKHKDAYKYKCKFV
jgi:hypothetical protein